MDKRWKNIIQEDVTETHKTLVRSSIESEFVSSQVPFLKPLVLWPSLGGMVAAGLLVAVFSRRLFESSPTAEIAVAAADSEMLENLDLFQELELFEDIDEMDQWEES